MKIFQRSAAAFKQIFLSTQFGWPQFVLVAALSLVFIAMPQKPQGNDWELNTAGFWADIPRTYLNNPNFVYPPWGLILLLPYYWLGAAGTRVLSVLTIGWLARSRGWSLARFFAIIFSPYFLLAMAISNMDILVVILPLLLWEAAPANRWRNLVRGLALALLLLKPQGTLLILLYLVVKNRKDWRGLAVQFAIVAVLIVPISLVGSPPLGLQWAHNLLHPSAANQGYWALNNLSISVKLGGIAALGMLLPVGLGLWGLHKKGWIGWKSEQSYSALVLFSMLAMPYASVQSFIAGLAFVPSWIGFLLQWGIVAFGVSTLTFYTQIHFFSYGVALVSLLAYAILQAKRSGGK